MNTRLTTAVCLAALLSACSDGGDSVSPQFSVDPSSLDVSQASYCDITQSSVCLFPFPNDYFTREDPATPTGKRVNFDRRAMLVNTAGEVMEPDEYNRNDGFSIGPMILAQVEGIDMGVTGAPSIVDMARSLDADSPIQLINADTGERQLIWAELDAYPEEGEPRPLIVRVGKSLENNQRYIVVMQGLRNAAGELLEPSDAFKVYQEGAPSDIPEIEGRREHFESLFEELEELGIDRDGLFLTWDFTTISTESTSARALHMRDTALADLGGAAPVVTVTEVTDKTPAEDENIAREVRGTITVPNFMDRATAEPGSRLNYTSDDPDALPAQFNVDGTVEVDFACAIPHAAFEDAADGDANAQAVVIGHGLFGNRDIALELARGAQLTNSLFCAMDFWGMSAEDVLPSTRFILGNLDRFPEMPDRLQQAFLNMIFLSEAMVRPGGFSGLEAFRDGQDNALYDPSDVQYNGVSMGTIYGGGLAALSPHFDNVALDLAGMNWSSIIRRANIWEDFSVFHDPFYPDPLLSPLGFSLVQMLWDRADSNGYANHITRDPLPGSRVSRILMQNAIGDQILTEKAGEFMQRSLGLKRHNPSLVEGRHIAVEPYIGIDPISTYPHEGSAVMHWDSGPFPVGGHDGTPVQRIDNLPETRGYDTHYGMPLQQLQTWDQKAEFWRTGRVINICGDRPCLGDGYDGTPGVYDPANAPES